MRARSWFAGCLLTLGAPMAGADPALEQLSRSETLAVALLEQLVEIDTTHASGDNSAAARAMAEHLMAAGFSQDDVRVIEPAPRKGNLVARLRSPAPEKKPILFLAHIDVVPADPADWTRPPFEVTVDDGYFYGRGVLDDKDEAAFAVANLIRLKQEGYRPNRDIIIALTADEEGGTHNGVAHLLDAHRDLVDAAFVINEGGGGAILEDGSRVLAMQAAEKVYQSYRLLVTNPGGHSSLPRADNAIYTLADALGKIEAHGFPVRFNEVTRAYFRQTAAALPAADAEAIERLLADPRDRDALAKVAQTPGFNARLRTTCVATRLSAGEAENALPQRAEATVNCRILPGVDPDSVRATLVRVVDNAAVRIEPLAEARPSPPSPLGEDIMAPVMAIGEALWPGVTIVPTMSTGATDAAYFRNAGIPVYGTAGVMLGPDDYRAHGRDERVLIRSFLEGLEYQYRLAKRLSN